MGTVIEQIVVTRGGWRAHHSALRLAVGAAKRCLRQADRQGSDIDLLVNSGIYRDRNLGEPALAALIQHDIGANAEGPHPDGHGTFSFDIANGTCGLLTAMQIVDGFLHSHAVRCALVVTSDADPGRGLSRRFPFSPVGAALLCRWRDDGGLGSVRWVNAPDGGVSFRATVGPGRTGNVLRFSESEAKDREFAAAGAEAAGRCIAESSLGFPDIDAVVAAPASRGYRAALADELGIPVERIKVAADPRIHTASLAAALHDDGTLLRPGARVLFIAAGAGITASAALYCQPDTGNS